MAFLKRWFAEEEDGLDSLGFFKGCINAFLMTTVLGLIAWFLI